MRVSDSVILVDATWSVYSHCRQTGQNHPFAFFRLRSLDGAGAGTGVAVAAPVDPAAFAVSSAPSAVTPAVPDAATTSSLLATFPPAPNSTIPTAHSRQTTKCRQGNKTTSLGLVKQTIHSLEVEA